MREKTEKKQNSNLLLRLGCLAAIAYLAITLVVSQVDIMVKRQQLDALQDSILRQQQQNTELQRLIASGDEMAYIEQIAHDKLGFAAPDERVFIDITGR